MQRVCWARDISKVCKPAEIPSAREISFVMYCDCCWPPSNGCDQTSSEFAEAKSPVAIPCSRGSGDGGDKCVVTSSYCYIFFLYDR